MRDNSYKIEGFELRVRQKPITETVVQSTSIDFSVRATPRIFLGADGRLYFQDNVIRDPVSLQKMENFYDRIRYENGELRFYTKDLESYVTLSQMVRSDDLLVNSNSVLYSSRNLWEPEEYIEGGFSALETIEDAYKEIVEPTTVPNTITDAISARDVMWDVFTNNRLRHDENESNTIFDTMVERFTYGIRGYGQPIPAEFCDAEDCTMQNKSFYFNDEKIGLSRLPTDLQGKIYLFDENLITLDNYMFTNFYKYNGVGKFVRKVFDKKTPSLEETYNDYFYEEDGYTTIIDPAPPTVGTFNISGAYNVQCGENIPMSGGNVGGVSLGKITKGWFGLKLNDGQLTISPSISANTVVPYVGCSNSNKIGIFECPVGEAPLDGVFHSFEVDDNYNDFKVWYSDHNPTDNSGIGEVKYVYSPKFFDLTGDFTVSAISNAVYEDDDGNLNRGRVAEDPIRWQEDTDTEVVGIFPKGKLTITLLTGAVRYSQDSSVFYNTPISGTGIGEVRSNVGVLSFEYNTPQEFEITSENEPLILEAWYQDNDNINNEGTITYSYEFEPEEKLLKEPPPAIHGEGIFHETSLAPYQDLALEEISRAWSTSLVQRFMTEMHQVLILNQYISGGDGNYYFGSEDMYPELIYTEDILEQTRLRFIDKKTTIKSELENAFEASFADQETKIINLSDYSEYSVGGQFKPENIYDVDFSFFNGVWFDLDGFNKVSPKISNDTGVSVLASLNVDVKHVSKARFEFRLFESVSQTELDRVLIESYDYTVDQEVGNILKDEIETFPIQLQYIGPIPYIQCTTDVFRKCAAESNLDVNSHVKINASDLYSPDAVHRGFKVITDRFRNLNIAANVGDFDNTTGGTNVIDLDTPRIFRVQWRMILDEDKAVNAHKRSLSDISFNRNVPRGDEFEISLNVYDLGDVSKKNLISQGVVTFDGKLKHRVSIPDLAASSGSEYSISLSCSKNVNVWYEDKTGSGFTIVSEKKFEGEVSWSINKQASLNTSEKNVKEEIDELPECLVDYKPRYGQFSNFDIFREEGYQVDVATENTIEDVDSSQSSEDIDDSKYIDPNGPECSIACINDCPDDWFCSSECPNSGLTQSGCACCECINNENCPEGYVCNDFGECVPGV